MALPAELARPQPPCAECGHRRIHHFILTRATRGEVIGDRPVPCSLPDCACEQYEPEMADAR